MRVLDVVLDDLAAESERLESLVVDLPESGWRTPTPAPGWDVATQIAHLAWTDEAARAAATDEERWSALVAEAMADPQTYADPVTRWAASSSPQLQVSPEGESNSTRGSSAGACWPCTE